MNKNTLSLSPTVKSAGGKTQLLPTLSAMIPKDYGKYIEPFVGGGAVLFGTHPQEAVIGDTNPALINFYRQIKANPDTIIAKIHKLQENPCNDAFYQSVRKRFNDKMQRCDYDAETAALFWFVNHYCFNGLYRVNLKGEFNVSFNKKAFVPLNEENLRALTGYLNQNDIQIFNQDFEATCKSATTGDFVFLDPPYYGTFDKYQPFGFTEDDQQRLFRVFRRLSRNGVFCILTNSDREYIRNLYKDYFIHEVSSKRSINCDGTKRTGTDLIITNYPVTEEDLCVLPESRIADIKSSIDGMIHELISCAEEDYTNLGWLHEPTDPDYKEEFYEEDGCYGDWIAKLKRYRDSFPNVLCLPMDSLFYATTEKELDMYFRQIS